MARQMSKTQPIVRSSNRLDAGLTAFIADLGDAFNETTIMVISEFGRIHSQRSYSIVRLRAACRHLARPANG